MTKHIELNNEVKQRGADGFYKLEKDAEAVEVFMREVAEKYVYFPSRIERVKWLIENNYYEDFFAMYSEEDVESLYKQAYDYQFKFQSYMAASKFYKDYSMRTNDKKRYYEHYEDRVVATAIYLGQGKFAKASEYVAAMMEQRYQPATPTFLNSGKARRGELVSCFLLESDDSLNSINYTISTTKQLSKLGGGIAINLSKIRSRGEAIKGIEDNAKGVVPVAKQLELGVNYADQLG